MHNKQEHTQPFFLRSQTEVVLLTIVTLGVYPVYWFYKAFRSIKELREKEGKATPSVWWAALSLFTSHIYFHALYNEYEKINPYKAHAWYNQPIVLSGLFFVTALLISPLSFIPLTIAQAMTKELHEKGIEFPDFEEIDSQDPNMPKWEDFE